MPEVKKGQYVQMLVSLSGDDFAYSPDQVLRVGKHRVTDEIDVGLANALVNDPPDDPRARVVDAETAQRLLLNPEVAQANETPRPSTRAESQKERAAEPSQGDPETARAEEAAQAAAEARRRELAAAAGEEDGGEPRTVVELEAAANANAGDTDTGDIDEEGEEDKVEDEERTQPEAEQATSEAAETRETATVKRTRSRPKPPKTEPKNDEEKD